MSEPAHSKLPNFRHHRPWRQQAQPCRAAEQNGKTEAQIINQQGSKGHGFKEVAIFAVD